MKYGYFYFVSAISRQRVTRCGKLIPSKRGEAKVVIQGVDATTREW